MTNKMFPRHLGSKQASRTNQILLGVTTAVALVFSIAIGPSGNAAGTADPTDAPVPALMQTETGAPQTQGVEADSEAKTVPDPTTAPVEPPAPTKEPVEPPAPTKAPVEPPAPTKEPVDLPVVPPGDPQEGVGESSESKNTDSGGDGDADDGGADGTSEGANIITTLGDMTTFGAGDGTLKWEMKDQAGALIGGATFEMRGPRTGKSSGNWNNQAFVVDCVSGACTGEDLDPAPGKFEVKVFDGHAVDDTKIYRIRPSAAPTGYTLDSTNWSAITPKGTSNTDINVPKPNPWNGSLWDFGTFKVTKIPSKAPICQPGYVYGITSKGQIRQVGPSGVVTNLGSVASGSSNALNGLGIGQNGNKVYAYNRTNSSYTASIREYDTTTGKWGSTLASKEASHTWVAGGVDLHTGAYYLGGFAKAKIDGSEVWIFHIWKYVPSPAQIVYQGYAQVSEGNEGLGNGDLAFNSDGDMFIVRGSTGSVQVASVLAADLATASAATTKGKISASIGTSKPTAGFDEVNGIAFDSNGQGYLGNGTTINAYTMPNWTNKVEKTTDLKEDASTSTDLASCSPPVTLSLTKNVEGSRVNGENDQFKLELKTEGGAPIEDATTKGNNSGVQTERVGPVVVVQGSAYNFSETFIGASTADYTSKWECKTNDGDVIGSASNSTSGSVVIPTNAESVTCEFTNAPLVANVTLFKEVLPVNGNGWVPGEDWELRTGIPNTPVGPILSPQATQSTDEDGSASWTIGFQSLTDKTTVTVSEEDRAGYTLESAECTANRSGVQEPITIDDISGTIENIGPGDTIECTFRNKEDPVTVIVNKQWVINGNEPVAHEGRPEGLTASLQINTSAQDWNIPYGPVGSADTVKVSEVAEVSEALLPKCTLGAATIGRVGSGASSDLNGQYTLPDLVAGENAFMITNSVTCEQELTLTKVVDNEVGGVLSTLPWKLEASAWDDELFATSGTTNLIFKSGVPQTDDVIIGDYLLSETALDGYLLESLTCDGEPIVDDTVTVGLGQSVSCSFTNKIAPGSVKWEKRNTLENLLAGSEWKLTGPAGQELPVTDCTSGACPGPDTDAVAGQIRLEGLAWGAYTLVETKAPAGYHLDPTPRTFVVGPNKTDEKVLLDWNLGVIENDQQSAPTLPLTGGLGTQIFLLIGGSALAVAAGMTAWRRKKGAPQTL